MLTGKKFKVVNNFKNKHVLTSTTVRPRPLGTKDSSST